MRRFIDVVRALIASGERTFWLAAMAVQPLLTQLLKRKYTASSTDAELERFFERHFVSGDRGESDWLAREISDQEIHDSITPATPDFLVLMLSCMVGQVDTPKLFKVNPQRYRESLAMGSVMVFMRSLIRRSARSLGKTQQEFESIEVQHRQWGGHRDGGGKTVESAADLEPRDAARDAGAVGSKMSGTGRGGLMIALTPTEELQNSVAAALEKLAPQVWKTTFA